MTVNVILREVEENDLDFLRDVYVSTRYEELKRTGWPQQQIDDFLGMQFEAQNQFYHEQFPQASYEIVQSNERDIGRLYLDYRDDEIRIVDIALLPEFRGTGLGTQLLKTVIHTAESKDLVVRIHVEKNNPALNLYQRLGFKQIEDRGVYLLMEKSSDKQAA